MTRFLLVIEMLSFSSLAGWMAWSTLSSARNDRRYLDPARFMLLLFSVLLVYRDWRILFADDSDKAKLIMCLCGILLCAFSAIAAKSYGRGNPIV